MNKFCHTGFSQIQELYNQHVEQIDSALQHCKETPCTNGMAGEPIPYQLRNDFAVTGIVFLCFFLAAPMLELLDYLRGNGFKTYIVSGGEVEFMRAWAQDVYGIPPEQVIGTTFVTEFQMQDGKPVERMIPFVSQYVDGVDLPGRRITVDWQADY